MTRFSLASITNNLSSVLQSVSGFVSATYTEQGKIIDETMKSLLKDIMQQFGMKPGIDYVDNLRTNEPATDFVTLSPKADELIRGLMNGEIRAISGHIRTSVKGKVFDVKPHFRKIG